MKLDERRPKCRSPSVDRQDVELRDLHMRRLFERKDNDAGNVLKIEGDASLIEICLFECPVAAMTFQNDARPREPRKDFGDADRAYPRDPPEANLKTPAPRPCWSYRPRCRARDGVR
jgi:hypothetical protein